eukprot:TRINITY_DN10690_c0_g1_i1.p1 TRINITY_DN10690_c0_g1~~TRINITY_DN10690_c0_g1_i1.p1  ORF type:complete len:278 (-),score=48.37 TRINITY_DN10690_c0_g1_i1:455-1288(-)
MSGLNVLISGASIARPATAYWFAKIGARVTVIERFSELRTGGQAIDIRTAGVSVMRKMDGMEAQVRSKFTQLEGISIVREDGRPYGVLRATGDPDQQSLVSEFEILRGDLSKILFDMTKDNEKVKYAFGEQISSMEQADDGPITVNFANGMKTCQYDLVIACDGATSRTRAIGLGCNVRDHIISTNCWAAYFSTKRDLVDGSKLGLAHSAIGGRAIAMNTDPSGTGRVMFMSIHPRDQMDHTLPFRQALSQGNEALKNYIAQYYQGVGWKTKLQSKK